jgi:hypothetical protein
MKTPLWIVFVISFLANPCSAQVKNILIDESVNGEPSLAINPRNPLNIVAAAAPDNIYFSVDGGKSWRKQKIQSSYENQGSPVIVCDNKGTFYLIIVARLKGHTDKMESSEVLVCHISSDGGKTWDEGTPFGSSPMKDQLNPMGAIDFKGNIIVSWTQVDQLGANDSTCHSSIVISSSANGKRWSKPVELSQFNGNCRSDDHTAFGATPGAGEDKKLYVTWSHANSIYLDRSFDGGGMWLFNDIVLSDQNGGWNLQVSGDERYNGMPVLVINKTKTEQRGLMYITWADQRRGEDDADIWFMRSHNFGDIWTPAMKVNDDSGRKHQFMPAMSVDDITGHIYILYFDRRNSEDESTDVYLAYSRDAGSTFKNTKVSEAPFKPGALRTSGRSTAISAYNGVITALWTAGQGEKIALFSALVNQSDLPK